MKEMIHKSRKGHAAAMQEPFGARLVQWFLVDPGMCEMSQKGEVGRWLVSDVRHYFDFEYFGNSQET